MLVKGMRWSVGEICTLTWMICIPSGDVPKLVGLVFRGAEGEILMQAISQPEYAACRDRGNPKRGGGKGGGKGSTPWSRVSVVSSRSCSSVATSGYASSLVSAIPMDCYTDLKFHKRKR